MDEFDKSISCVAREFEIRRPSVGTNLLYLGISEKTAAKSMWRNWLTVGEIGMTFATGPHDQRRAMRVF